MKLNILLALGGTVVGVFLGAAVGWGALALLRSQPAGSSFESLTDLREKIVERDDRDVDPVRGVSLRSIIVPHPNDEIIYTLAPNLNLKFQGAPVRTNAFGFRGPETTLEKPKGVYRVVLLGDSFAFGWGVKDEESFARVIEKQLTDLLGDGRRVEVLNFGIPGYSTFQEYALYAERGAQFHPDAVLVYFVDNDYGLPFFIRDVEQGNKLRDAVSVTKRAWNSDNPAVAEQKKKFWRILDPNRALQKLSKLTRQQGVQMFFVFNPRQDLSGDRKRLRILRRAKHIHTLGISEKFFQTVKERAIPKEQLQLPGDLHPSATKHAILGELIAEEMRGFLPPAGS